MKKFTNKKIYERLEKVENLNFALVLENGELYIHRKGQAMLQDVYEDKDRFCDVTDYIRDYNQGEYNKNDTARMIREAAETFYE